MIGIFLEKVQMSNLSPSTRMKVDGFIARTLDEIEAAYHSPTKNKNDRYENDSDDITFF